MHAQNATVYTEQGELIRASRNITAVGPALIGDGVNLYTGAVEFTHTDVSLPGNNALPVAVGRRYVASTWRGNMYEGLFLDWDLDIPHLHGTYAAGLAYYQGWIVEGNSSTDPARLQRCSAFGPPPPAAAPNSGGQSVEADDFWSGHFLYVPGGGDQKMLLRDPANTPQPTDGYTYPVVTKNDWQFRCITGLASPKTAKGTEPQGEGFIARAPDGTQYRFDWIVSRPYRGISTVDGGTGRQEVWILPTLVTDRFGNTVQYTYDTADPWKLQSIVASDGRVISLSYSSGHRVASVNDGTRTWTYSYGSGNGFNRLSTVTLPDNSAWSFALNEQQSTPSVYLPNRCTNGSYSDGTLTPSPQTSTINHPSGASASFVFQYVMQGRSGMSSYPGNPCPATGTYDFGTGPVYPVRSLMSKTLTGPAISTLTWSYDWGAPNGSFYCGAGCPDTRTISVTDARGVVNRYTYGNRYLTTEGQLQQSDEAWDSNSSTALRTTTYNYRAAGAGPYPLAAGSSGSASGDDLMETRHLLLWQRTIAQQGTNFTWQAEFDSRVRTIRTTRIGPSGTKREDQTYSDNLGLWVINQPASLSDPDRGLVMQQRNYNASALPTASYAFGRLAAQWDYNADGTLAHAYDSAGHATTFTNYKRGLARTITYADQTSESADVNDIGLITLYTNAAGTTTTYSYDAMGRLAGIGYPAESGGGYYGTTLTFERVLQDEYGIPAGHWRQTIGTGNARTIHYFDALWRVGLSRTFDAGNEGGTASVVETHYDPDGRTVYQSQPQRSINTIGSGVPGTNWSYDGLGRIALQRQDSELGALDTGTEYLNGFYRRTTNPRGYQTTAGFQAFDVPSEDAPTTIWLPENATVTINRDVFGKPTAITRGGAYAGSGPASVTRSYVYDAYQRLCKTIEPESGATVQDYDAANNVAWRASGLDASNACGSAPGNRTISYGYDARNRLTSTSYGDGSQNISRGYTPDGLLSQITASKPGTNTISWAYTYNNRRLLTNERYQWGDPNNWWDFNWAIDANGHVSSLTDPWGTMGYAPNALGQPTQVSGYVSNVVYHPNGTVNGYQLSNGKTHHLGLNARGLPEWWYDAGVTNDVYTYDANGNVSSITDHQQGGVTNRSMAYDGLDRLTQANGMWGAGSFYYDALDNMRVATLGGRSTTLSYNPANRLAYINTNGVYTSYGYDANGNVTQRGGQQFSFDIGNRMTNAPGAVNGYLYDGHGRRNLVFWPNDYMHQAYTQDGKLRFAYRLSQGFKRHVFLGNTLIAETADGGVTTFMHTDALGSPVATTNASGGVISRTHYEPYGKTWAGTDPARIGFTGHVNDPDTGLVYMQQRYYDPVAGRFLSVDPVVTDWDSGSSFNRYVYAQNNPYRYTDPDGRNPVVMAAAAACARSGACVTAVAATVAAAGQAVAKGADAIGQAISRILNQSDSGSGPQGGEVQQAPGNKPPFTGEPGSTVQGGTGSRTYGPDGYPKTDRDSPHPDEKGPGSGDHAHDWGRPKDGGPPTHNDRGPARDPKKDDPPPPRGPNTPPKEK